MKVVWRVSFGPAGGNCLFKAWGVGGLCAPQQDALHRESMLDVVLSVWPRISEGHGHQVCHVVQKKVAWAGLVSAGYEHTCVSAHMATSSFFSS